MIKLSIILPIYNVEKYIYKCITNLVNQATPECELIIVDDGTKDFSIEIAKGLIPHYINHTIIHKKNGGLSDARNYGIRAAHGEYLVFVDPDDYVSDDYIDTIIKTISKRPDFVIFGYNVIRYNDRSEIKKIKLKNGKFSTETIGTENISALGYAWNKIYKTSIIRENALEYEVGTSYIEDILFNAEYIKYAEKISVIDAVIYNYVQYDFGTLGKNIYANMLELDLRANKALYVIVKKMVNDENLLEKIYNTNLICRLLYSINIIIDDRKSKPILRQYSDYLSAHSFKPLLLKDKIQYVLLKNRRYGAYKIMRKIGKIKIKNIIPFEAKFCIKAKFGKASNSYSKEEKKIFIFLSANYGNLGDVLITEAQEKFLKNAFPDYKVYKINADQVHNELNGILRNKNKNDIYTIIGGGNFGNKYEQLEYIRKYIIKRLKRSKIIAFPQTLTTAGNRDVQYLKKSSKTYDRKNILLLCRDRKTYETISSTYGKLKIGLFPDIVLSLNKYQAMPYNKNIVFCLRDDNEKIAHGNVKISDYRNYKITYKDTQISRDHLTDKEVREEIKNLTEKFKNADLVVTDRLHGMILARIVGRPFIAFDNYNKKISRVYNEWLTKEDGIIVHNMSEVSEKLIAKTINNYKYTPYSNHHFNELENIMKNFIGHE